MPNHRAPTTGSRALSGLALTTAAVGASLLSSVGSAAASPAGAAFGGGTERLTGADHDERPPSADRGCDIRTGAAGLESALERADVGEVVCVPASTGGRHRAHPERAGNDEHARPDRRPRHARPERSDGRDDDGRDDDRDGRDDDRDSDSDAGQRRPMTSGERQYRNGCEQGYISSGCERFSVRSLLRAGIDPYL